MSQFGNYQRYLYAKAEQGLLLNTEGSSRLRMFFLTTISTVDLPIVQISDYVPPDLLKYDTTSNI